MWSCQSGSAGSRWPALEVQSTPVWTIWRSGENLSAGPWLLMFSRVFSVLTCVFVLRSGSRLWQKCCSKYANSCRSCRTRSTTAPAPPTLLLPWQKSRISRCPCTQNFCQSETWHHVIQTHRLTHIHTHTLSYCWHVLLCCCPAALWWLRNNPSCRVHHNDLWFWRPGWDSQRQWGEAHEKLVRTQLVL